MNTTKKWIVGASCVWGLAICGAIGQALSPPPDVIEEDEPVAPFIDDAEDEMVYDNEHDIIEPIEAENTTENLESIIEGVDQPTYIEPVSTTPEPEPISAPAPAPAQVEPEPVAEDSTLPLKARCKDGTIQYQDSPSLPNYRGMCSSHGGIVERFGRVL